MLKHLLWIKGRANRTEFLFWSLLIMVVNFLSSFLVPSPGSSHYGVWLDCVFFAMLPFVWMSVMLLVRRFHDWNYSGWWVIPFLVIDHFIGNIGSLLINLAPTLIRGTSGENRFGTSDKRYYSVWMEQKTVWVICFLLWGTVSVVNPIIAEKHLQQLKQWQQQTTQQLQNQF